MERAVQEKKTVRWDKVRDLFDLNRDYIQLGASQFIVSHPKPVRDAIDKIRNDLDKDPVLYTQEKENSMMQQVRKSAARFHGVEHPDDIAITDSTTMGLGLIYTALNIRPGQEVLATEHDHYSHHE